MFRTLLVPLDGSTFGEYALPHAIAIARRAGAALKLVHVFKPVSFHSAEIGTTDGLAEVNAVAREQARAYLERTARRVREVASVEVEPRLLEGQTAWTLVEHAKEAGVDLVVMTTHGRGPLSRFWLGSIADEVTRTAPMPVILIRPAEDHEPDLTAEPTLRRILVALDGSGFSEQILKPTLALGGLMEAEYRLLRVAEPSYSTASDTWFTPPVPEIDVTAEREAREYLEQVRERLRGEAAEVDIHVETGELPAETIFEVAGRYKPDLIALATHGRSGLVRQFLGSVADKLLRGTLIPVLLNRPEEHAA